MIFRVQMGNCEQRAKLLFSKCVWIHYSGHNNSHEDEGQRGDTEKAM